MGYLSGIPTTELMEPKSRFIPVLSELVVAITA